MAKPIKNNTSICGSMTKSGTICRKPAGWGTQHRGRGRCSWHGGNLPDHIKNELRHEAHAEYGAHADIEPAEAILLCIRIASGEVYYFDERCKELAREDIVLKERRVKRGYSSELGRHREVTESNEAKLNIFIRARQEATDRLMRYSKIAIELELDERRVRVAEQWGMLLGQLIRRVLDRIGLTEKQMGQVPKVLREELLQLERGDPMVIDQEEVLA